MRYVPSVFIVERLSLDSLRRIDELSLNSLKELNIPAQAYARAVIISILMILQALFLLLRACFL